MKIEKAIINFLSTPVEKMSNRQAIAMMMVFLAAGTVTVGAICSTLDKLFPSESPPALMR